MKVHEPKLAGRRPWRLSRGPMVALFLVGFLPLTVLAGPGPGEGEVKTAFVLNFIKFVEWPASAFSSPEDPIRLSVLGDDPNAASLASLDGKNVSGRRLDVRKVPNLAALERCHVLFVGASEKTQLAPVLGKIQRWPTLTVADFEGFADRGGTIGLIRRDNRVGFEINEESARKAGLKVSSKLLYLGKGTHVHQRGER